MKTAVNKVTFKMAKLTAFLCGFWPFLYGLVHK